MLPATLRSGNAEARLAIQANAPELVSEPRRTASLVRAIEEAEAFAGQSQTLLDTEQFHPPPVVHALLRGLLDRDGATACNFAALGYFLHGKAASAFDWNLLPIFLRFNTEDRAERERAARDLCANLGTDSHVCLGPRSYPRQPGSRRRARR